MPPRTSARAGAWSTVSSGAFRKLTTDLASLSHSGPGPSTAENKLTARVRALEQELQRKEAEISRLARASTSTPKSRRRRSSVGDYSASLTNQRDDAAQAAAAAQREVSGLKARLSAAERERDQALNARMAAEKRAARDTESLQDRVDELQFYLDQKGGSQPAQASEKARSERDAALARVEELEGRLKEKETEVEETQARLEEREKELEALRDGAGVAEGQVDELRQKITTLEAQLLRAEGVHTERTAHIERERDAARSEADALQRRVNDATEDLQKARAEVDAERDAHGAMKEQLEVSRR